MYVHLGLLTWHFKNELKAKRTIRFEQGMSKKPTSSPWSRRPVRKSGKKKVSTSAFKGRTSVRHTFRDRLRAVECPIDMIDQTGGWKSAGSIGTNYG